MVSFPCYCCRCFRAPDKKFAVQRESILSGGGTDSKVTGDIGVVRLRVSVAFNDFPPDGSAEIHKISDLRSRLQAGYRPPRDISGLSHADEAVIARFLPIDVVLFRPFHGGPVDVDVVAHHPVGGMLAHGLPRRGGQGFHALPVHGDNLVAQGEAKFRRVVRVAAHKGRCGRARRGKRRVQNNGLIAPHIGSRRTGSDDLAQRVLFMRQIHHVPDLPVRNRVEVFRPVGRGHVRIQQPCAVGNAQPLLRKNQHEILIRLGIEGKGQKHGRAVQFRDEAHTRPAYGVAVQVGQKILHVPGRGLKTPQIVAGGKSVRQLPPGEIAKGDAHVRLPFLTGMWKTPS